MLGIERRSTACETNCSSASWHILKVAGLICELPLWGPSVAYVRKTLRDQIKGRVKYTSKFENQFTDESHSISLTLENSRKYISNITTVHMDTCILHNHSTYKYMDKTQHLLEQYSAPNCVPHLKTILLILVSHNNPSWFTSLLEVRDLNWKSTDLGNWELLAGVK